jgi:hypothetical protein
MLLARSSFFGTLAEPSANPRASAKEDGLNNGRSPASAAAGMIPRE